MVRPRRRRRQGATALGASLVYCLLGAISPVRWLHAHAFAEDGRAEGSCARARRKEISFLVDGQHRHRTSRKQTIAAALEEADIDVGPLDEVQPPLLSPLYAGTTITVTRVTTREVTVEEKLPYRTVLDRSASRFLRHPTIKRVGRPGRVRNRYRVTYRSGVPIRRKLLASQVLRPALPQIVQLQRNRLLSSRGVFGGRRIFQMVATAYDPGPGSCGPRASGRTCLGLRAGYGVVAVDPRHIPLRTRLFIEGYGYAIAGDVGRAIKGNRIDLGYSSRRAALRFGRRKVKVRVVD
jgi:3D (Asp-Asp-Asp) domain-containing protein